MRVLALAVLWKRVYGRLLGLKIHQQPGDSSEDSRLRRRRWEASTLAWTNAGFCRIMFTYYKGLSLCPKGPLMLWRRLYAFLPQLEVISWEEEMMADAFIARRYHEPCQAEEPARAGLSGSLKHWSNQERWGEAWKLVQTSRSGVFTNTGHKKGLPLTSLVNSVSCQDPSSSQGGFSCRLARKTGVLPRSLAFVH